MERLMRARLCATTPGQMGYLAGLEGPREWMAEYRERLLAQRDYCIERIQYIDGLETQTPNGAFYLFAFLPGIDELKEAFDRIERFLKAS